MCSSDLDQQVAKRNAAQKIRNDDTENSEHMNGDFFYTNENSASFVYRPLADK